MQFCHVEMNENRQGTKADTSRPPPRPPLPLIVWRVETQRRGIFDNSDSFPEGRADAWN